MEPSADRILDPVEGGRGVSNSSGTATLQGFYADDGAAPADKLTGALIEESIPFVLMFQRACSLNCPKQVSKLI